MFQFFRNLKEEIANAPPFQFSLNSTAVSRHELKIITFWSAIIALFVFLPYLYAYLFTPAELYFVGGLSYCPDHSMHLAWSYQAAQGKFLCKNLYTSISHEGALFNLYLFSIGILSRITGWSLDACYQIVRFFTSWSLGIAVYYFVALFFTGRERLWGWLAAMFAGGLSWILVVLKHLFTSQTIKDSIQYVLLACDIPNETSVFLSMLYFPLYSAALTFLCFTLRWSLIAIVTNNYMAALIAGGLLFLVSFVHPYDVIFIVTVLCAAATILTIFYQKQWKQWTINLAIICIFGVPSILYNYWILQTNPGFSMWGQQNLCTSASIFSYIVGLGLPCLLSIFWLLRSCNVKAFFFGLFIVFLISINRNFSSIYLIPEYIILLSLFLLWYIQNFKKNNVEFCRFLLISSWILLFPILIYIPVPYQNRLSPGLSVPFAILSIDYLRIYFIRHKTPSKIRGLIYFIFIFISSLNYIRHYASANNTVMHPYLSDRQHYGRCQPFVPKEEITAIAIIEKGPNNGSVLNSAWTSYLIPRYTGKQVVCGSMAQTDNSTQTEKAVHQFYSGEMPPTKRVEFLKEKHVAYIFYGPEEKELDATRSLPTWLKKNHWKPIAHPTDKTYGIFVKEDTPVEAGK